MGRTQDVPNIDQIHMCFSSTINLLCVCVFCMRGKVLQFHWHEEDQHLAEHAQLAEHRIPSLSNSGQTHDESSARDTIPTSIWPNTQSQLNTQFPGRTHKIAGRPHEAAGRTHEHLAEHTNLTRLTSRPEHTTFHNLSIIFGFAAAVCLS